MPDACRGTLFLELLCDNPLPSEWRLARYFRRLKGRRLDEFLAPNPACFEAILRDCGFVLKA